MFLDPCGFGVVECVCIKGKYLLLECYVAMKFLSLRLLPSPGNVPCSTGSSSILRGSPYEGGENAENRTTGSHSHWVFWGVQAAKRRESVYIPPSAPSRSVRKLGLSCSLGRVRRRVYWLAGFFSWSVLLLNNSLGSGEEKSKSVSVTCPIKNNQLGQEMSVCFRRRAKVSRSWENSSCKTGKKRITKKRGRLENHCLCLGIEHVCINKATI